MSSNRMAIVGYSYRMPGGIRSDEDFWRVLSEREIVQEPITDRYGRGYRPIAGFSGPGRFASPFEGLILDGEELLFDCRLFGMSRHEAENLDPQMRMLLTCTWETFEQTGWDMYSRHDRATGVFVGAQAPVAGSWRPLHGVNEYTNAGISLAMQANRISYHFNLDGPSMTCCTACSAGLSALHTAINAIGTGDCKQAIVGSANYLGGSMPSLGFNALGVISPDGKCYSLDERANGYMRSEGVFVFAIKPLIAAERDGDPIHGVIEATAVNTAGVSEVSGDLTPRLSIFAPTRRAQVELMRTACRRAGISPTDVDYIEAHATGTQVGDTVEGNAVAEVFDGLRKGMHPLRVSSVKSNVGHMEAAAFHCALQKVILMMQRRTFAPISENFTELNPEIDFGGRNISVLTTCEPFPDRSVVVGINSFGFGGANGHCLLREYRPSRSRVWSVPMTSTMSYMIPLSARTPEALVESARRLNETMLNQKFDLYSLAGNLSRRRTHFNVRTAFAIRNPEELAERLNAFLEERAPVATTGDGVRRIAMVFSGQGTQSARCGHELYEAYPVFRRVIDTIEEHWREHSGVSLRDVCFSATQTELNECDLAQPAIFMLQCALLELFKTWGVFPDCVVGHSSGEVAAAYASGLIPLADATRVVFQRARLQQQVAGSGRMLAISLGRAAVEELIQSTRYSFVVDGDHEKQVEFACENGPASTVICGMDFVLKPIQQELQRRNVPNQLLPGNIAFHSSAMDEIEDEVLSALSFLDDCDFHGDVPLISSVTGRLTERLDSAYWWSNIRQPVKFAAAMQTISQDYGPDVVLEIAPHGALQPIIAQCLSDASPSTTCVAALMKNTDSRVSFNEALAALYRTGVDLDFAAQYPRPEPITHLLPGHLRVEKRTSDPLIDDRMFVKQGEYSKGPLVGHRIPCEDPLFEARLSEKDFPWLVDHRVYRTSIMPAAAYIELVLEALDGAPVHFDEIEFLQPCAIPRIPVRLQTALHPVADAPDRFTFAISSRSYDEVSEALMHCRGKVRLLNGEEGLNTPRKWTDIDKSRFESTRITERSDFYSHLDAVLGDDYQYGPFFQTVQKVDIDVATKDTTCQLMMDEELWNTGREEGYVLSPALTDGGLQMFLYYMLADLSTIPRRARNVTFFGPPTSPHVHCYLKYARDRSDWSQRNRFSALLGERTVGSVSLYDSATASLVLHIEDYICFNSSSKRSKLRNSKHVVSWQPKRLPTTPAMLRRLPDGEIDLASLINSLKNSDRGISYACRVVEFAGSRAPDETILKEHLDSSQFADGRTEFWLVTDDGECAQTHYEAFAHHEATLRFECHDLNAQPVRMPDSGLLRPGASELVVLHYDTSSLGPEVWRFLRQLAVPRGLALVYHQEDEVVQQAAGWTRIRAGRKTTLLQAKRNHNSSTETARIASPVWVLGEPKSWASQWASLIDAPEVYSIPYETITTCIDSGSQELPWVADVREIDFLCGMDSQDPTGEELVSRFVAFVRSLAKFRMENANEQCRFTVITHRAAFEVEDPRGTALWGAVRTAAVEIGEAARIDFRLVDLGSVDDLHTLARLSRCDLRERELAVRRGRLWVPRVISIQDELPLVDSQEDLSYRLCINNPGQIKGLEMRTFDLDELGPGDVEVEVAAAGLNFRDLIVTLDLLPRHSYKWSSVGREVGMEASGIVRRIGSKVRRFSIGDEVVFMKGGCIANRVVLNEHIVSLKPMRMSLIEAASVSSAYITAFYALAHLARLREGQRVLIHSAMGGVGQAAVAIARCRNAEIYATAGNESKRAQLAALGVSGVFDSRSFDWYDQLMTATGGKGVDVVLNSLAGRHIDLCLEALHPGGWHCEIGKVDIYAENQISMRAFKKNLRFAGIDMDRLVLDDPKLVMYVSKTCLDLLDQGVLPPLQVTEYPYKDYQKALRLMMSGQHTGKLVLTAPKTPGNYGFPIIDCRSILDADATYLVTGGLGDLGLKLLCFLAASGARHITVMDRDSKGRRSSDWIRKSSEIEFFFPDCKIHVILADVAKEGDVRRCIGELDRPLRGVFHLAGVLDDRSMQQMTRESFAMVFGPKARGALYLHRATIGCDLDHFVLFSSIASTFGNPGQINYSAANSFLDGLAACRRRKGLPGLAYNMAAIAETGMASRNPQVLRMARAVGVPPISTGFALINLDYALRKLSDESNLISALFERPAWSLDSPDYMRSGRLICNQSTFGPDSPGQMTIDDVMLTIANKAAELIGHEVDVNEPLSSLGFSSISVVELGAYLHERFNCQFTVLDLVTTASARSLATAIVHGHESDAGKEAETQEEATGRRQSSTRHMPARKLPSVFSNRLEDHFPRGFIDETVLAHPAVVRE